MSTPTDAGLDRRTLEAAAQVAFQVAQYVNATADDIASAIRALPAEPAPSPASEPVAVKPLEWKRPVGAMTLSRAETVLGPYRVWTHAEADGQWFWELDNGKSHDVASEAIAKAAAQADYTARILSALAASPLPAQEPVATAAEMVIRLRGAAGNLTHSDRDVYPVGLLLDAADFIASPQPYADGVEAAARVRALEEALQSIAEATDADDPESYRSDDREGCLDTVHAIATAALSPREHG